MAFPFSKVSCACIASMVVLGFLVHYSASGGKFDPFASHQLYIFLFFAPMSVIISIVDINFFHRNAYKIFGFSFLLLSMANLFGPSITGVHRWIRFGGFSFQPSELMKLSLILALAKYFSGCRSDDFYGFKIIILPVLILLLPVMTILKQPNFGTAIILILIGLTIFYFVGVSIRYFIVLGITTLISIPIAWNFMYEYQKRRILSFLEPDSDPLNSGYNTLQSKIAIGSGGVWGKGFLSGTQAQLKFLPEKHTDFAFTVFAEESGFIGAFLLIIIYFLFIIRGLIISIRALQNNCFFNAILCVGICSMYFWHVVINVGMVIGMFPVVGVPLPFISYGGSMMMTATLAFGLLMNVHMQNSNRSKSI